ncbi:MAG: response regulator, partial [Deltaproteobacteria bacterium]|nr:response regulator [Deltaproteobacteria bacterium]
RVNPQDSTYVEGTGLGLTITRSLCNMMDGEVSFKSSYGSGSTFTAKVPQVIAKNEPFAEVIDPKTMRILLLSGRDDYAASYELTLKNLKLPYKLTRSQDEFKEALTSFIPTHVLIQDSMEKGALEQAVNFLPLPKIAVITASQAGRPGKSHTYLTGPLYCLPLCEFLSDLPLSRFHELNRDPFTMPEARLLVVDDLETNLQVAAAILGEYDCQVDLARSGKEAIAMVRKNTYDLIFMDHLMPEMDGLEAAKIIRSLDMGRFNSLPIVALTANAVSGMKDMFLSQGLNDFISKPIDLIALSAVLRRLIDPSKIIPGEKKKKDQSGKGDGGYSGEGSPNLGSHSKEGDPPDYSGMMAYGARVLIVDDLSTNLEVARSLLSEFGCDVDLAASGQQAIDKIQENPYDIVFMDHMMPNMDGLEATRIIRSMDKGRFKELPIIALTANTILGMRETFLSSGFDDYIPKPIDVRVLESVLGRWLPQDLVILPQDTSNHSLDASTDPTDPKDASPEENDDSQLDFQKGIENSRSKEGYQRVLSVFLKEAGGWVRQLNSIKSRKAWSESDCSAMVRDMESSATIVGASGLADLSRSLSDAAKSGDFQRLRREIDRAILALTKIQTKVLNYQARNLKTSRSVPDDYESPAVLNAAAASLPQTKSALGLGMNTTTIRFPGYGSSQSLMNDSDLALSAILPLDSKERETALATAESARSAYAALGGESAQVSLPDDSIEAKAQVDFKAGLNRCRGKLTNYRKLLSYFSSDLKGWIELFKNYPSPDSPDLKFMTITFHSMKSASETIGASGLSKEAERLEAAGRKSDLTFVEKNIPNCLTLLQKVLANIVSYLEG